jgi:hypothetical protein
LPDAGEGKARVSPDSDARTRAPEAPAVEPVAALPASVAVPAFSGAALDGATVIALQRSAGNAAVSRLVAGASFSVGFATPRGDAAAGVDVEVTAGLAEAARDRERPNTAPGNDAQAAPAADRDPAPAAEPTDAAPATTSDALPPVASASPPTTASSPPEAASSVPESTGIAPAASPPGAVTPSAGDAKAAPHSPPGATTAPDAKVEATPAPAASAPPATAAPSSPAAAPIAAAASPPGAKTPAAADAKAPVPAAAAASPRGSAPAGSKAPVSAHGAGAAHAGAGRAPRAAVAAPAPAAPESAELDAWQAAVDGAKNSIPGAEKEEVAAAPAKLAGEAAQTEQARAAERPDYPAEARTTLPPDPKPEKPVEQLDTAKADEAVAKVDGVGKAKLSDQALPPMVAMPGGLAPPPAPTAAPPATAGGAKTETPGGATRPDPAADAALNKITAVRPGQAGLGPAGPAIAHDAGAASLDPLPPAQATHIGDVATRVLASAPEYAREILDAASGVLDPGKRVAEYANLAKEFLTGEEQGLTAELQGIAAAAGVSAEQLNAKVAAQKQAAAEQHATTAAQLDEKGKTSEDTVKQRGEFEQQQISGASVAVKDEVDRKQEAAKGASDPSVINARRDAYLQKVADAAAAGSARLRAAKEKRAADLQRLGAEQKATYRREAQAAAARAADAAGTNAAPQAPGSHTPDDKTAQKIAARPALDWGDKQGLEVDGHVARLTREAGEEIERLEAAIKEAADGAKEQIRDWAVERQGRQRTWWDRLIDMITDYVSQAKADNKAWEAQRNAETRNQVASDLTKLARLRDEMKRGNREAVLAEMSRMSKEERAVVEAFFKSGGRDAIGAVAAGLVARVKGHRVPELSKQLEDKAIERLTWEQLNQLGMIQTPGFDAGLLVREVRGAVKGWGTNESRLFKALEGHTPLQIAALRKAYKAVYDRNMDEDINDDLSGSERERADALRTGDATAGAIATLNDAMDGAGTDEKLIMETLRGKTPAQRDAIIAAYEKKYGHSLNADLKSEMGGYELGQAEALVEGDTTKADAMELKDAMAGAGTDEKAIYAVYSRMREEVESEASAKGMKTAEVEAEIKRRSAELTRVYGARFGVGLEADLRSEMKGGELNKALAGMSADQTALDAATLQDEHESAWTSDEKVNDVLKSQYTRAEKEILRDLAVDFNERSIGMSPKEKKAAWEAEVKRGKQLAFERSKQNMGDLQSTYDRTSGHTFDALIANEVSGYDQDEARDRITSGGKLSDEKELKYAIYGLGTKEQVIRDTLKGKSKEEIRQLKLLYEAETDGGNLLGDLQGDLSGRDEADMTILLETGDSTPEEKLEYLKRRKTWELGDGTGFAGEGFLDEESRVLEATTAEAEAQYKRYAELKAKGDDDPAVVAERERLERWLGYGEKDIERHREEMDSITDTIALVGGIAVGVAFSILTAGVGAAAVAAVAGAIGVTTTTVAAAAGAIVAVGVGIGVKQSMKGAAYGGEDMIIDGVQGLADTIVAIGTAGAGTAALKALSRSPALKFIERLAESGVLKRMVYTGAEGAIDGAISGLPSGMVAALLDENTWKSDNPFLVIVQSGKSAAIQGAGMGSAQSAGMEGGRTAVRGLRGRPPQARPAASGETPAHHAEPEPTPLDHPDAPHIEESPPGGFPVEGEPHIPAEPDYDPGPPHEIEVENLPDAEAPEIHESPPGGYPVEGEPHVPAEPDYDPGPPQEIEIENTPEVEEDPTPLDHPDAPHIEESPPGGFPIEGEPHVPAEPDYDLGPPAEIELPAPEAEEAPRGRDAGTSDDGPTGVHEDGPTGVHEDSPTGEFDGRRTGEWVVPERMPLMELPPGSIMYHDRGLTHVEARRMYESAIAESQGGRELMILENRVTREQVVIQGDRSRVRPGADTWAEFMADGGSRGDWRVVRHYHPVRDGGVTPPLGRYPSGMGGDMSAVRAEALRNRQIHAETLDIRTENGRQEVHFGYEPGAAEPYFVGIEQPGGGHEFHRFRDLEHYHEWVFEQTGERMEPIARPDPARPSRDAGDGHQFDDEPTDVDAHPYGADPAHRRPLTAEEAHQRFDDLDEHEAYRELADQRVLNAELDQLLLELGQQPLAPGQLSPAHAEDLFQFLSQMKFPDVQGFERSIPFHYPVDGCWGRAHMMAETMAAMGIESRRVFATSTVPSAPLEVRSNFSADQGAAGPPVTRWWYHVAPIVEVRTPAGVQYLVIDPSTQSRPVTVGEWLATMGVAEGGYRELTHEQLMAHLAAGQGGPQMYGFPVNERLVWETDRHTMYPGEEPAADSTRANTQLAGEHARLTDYANRAAVHALAAAVRDVLARPDATLANVLAVVRGGGGWQQWLWSAFPQLRAQLVQRFPGQEAAIDAAVKP